jgi:hypothetical protein
VQKLSETPEKEVNPVVARLRNKQHIIARVAIFALAAGAFVALSGLPAQAQVLYSYPYYGTPYYNYGAACETFSLGVLAYSNCPVYYTTPYYAPYYPHTYYYSRPYRWTGQHGR